MLSRPLFTVSSRISHRKMMLKRASQGIQSDSHPLTLQVERLRSRIVKLLEQICCHGQIPGALKTRTDPLLTTLLIKEIFMKIDTKEAIEREREEQN